ncbi:MAG: hypothetical protein ACRDP6_29235 [Actinoallomurus sp.]
MNVFPVILALLLLAAGALWVCQSLSRVIAAALVLVLVATHGTPPLWLCATLAAGLATLAVAIAVRALDEFGWRLMVATGGE